LLKELVEETYMDRLSPGQTKLMWMVIEGMTDKEIAATRGVALSTVKNSMVVIYDKLEAKNRAHAVYRFCFDGEREG
jgi:DNA-binding NarL/FixJ family response regulator